MNKIVETIKVRWTQREWIQEWVSLSKNRKDKVLADLEENSRQMSEEDKELSFDYLTAINTLESISIIGQEQNESQAIKDIKELLKEIR